MIELGKAIYKILTDNTGVTSLVDQRIYPIVAPKDTVSPLIVYERRSNPDDTKDNSSLYQTNVEFIIIDNNYTSTINIALALQSALEHYKGTVEGINIKDIKLFAVDERYAEDGYTQLITFVVISI